jgi:SNF2 family DNA or RNA helicase
MGLGKTIQTITFLLSKKDEGPSLVIAPASVAPNWKTEFQRFAPSLNITMLNFAADREKVIKNAGKGDVVVTTYGLLLSVKDFITSKKWTTICLDEAHIVKNRGAKTSAVAMKLKSRYRVMLTGTPIQNHLGELWNLFQFVNPGLLGSFESFNRRFIIPIEQYDDTEARKRLERLIKPFMLRRTKDRVARELPEKEEIYQHVDLSEEEMLVYETLRQRAENLLLADQGSHVSLNTLAEITHLRQCACDIRLVENAGTDNEKEGSKIVALIELLQTILESHAAALVFSQFTSYLSLIRRALDKADIPYLYIDGSVPIKEREKMVERFQSGECPVFLISLKAGGLGLNLTRANYVVHMDPWWNPAIEAQATDRAHRIGQKNNVTVYHLIAESTIEEKIQRMHEQKQELVENILESTDKSYKLTGEELLKLVHS